jgi:hypothetical protein
MAPTFPVFFMFVAAIAFALGYPPELKSGFPSV